MKLKPTFHRPNYVLVNTKKDFVPFFQDLMKQSLVACDLETNGFRHIDDHIIGLSFSFGLPFTGYYIPVRHRTGEKNLWPEFAFKWLKKFYEDPDISKIWWNGKFDKKFLLAEETGSICVQGRQEDGMIACHVLDENELKGLDHQAKKYIHKEADIYDKHLQQFRREYARKTKIPDPTRKKGVRQLTKEEVTYDYIPFEIMVPYAASDTDFTLQRWHQMEPQLEQDRLREVYERDLAMNEELIDIEHRGVLIDPTYCAKKSKELDKIMQKALRRFYKKAGAEVNINSPKQLIELFEKSGVKVPEKKRKNGVKSKSVDNDVLQQFAKNGNELAQMILDYKEHLRAKTTYLDVLPSLIQSDGMVHGSNNVAGTVTGRSSCNDPNLMNQPRGDIVRSAFVAPDDYIYLKGDLSQIELRLAAYYSQDEVMLDTYCTDGDLHLVMGRELAEMAGEDWDELEKDQQKEYRRRAKAVNFGLLFGMMDQTFIEYARIQYGVIVTPRESKRFYNAFHNKFAGYSAWMDRMERKFLKRGEAVDYFGRVRRVPELLNPRTPDWMKNRMVRQLWNFYIQGTAADLFKIAFLRICELLREEKAKSRLVVQVHDEVGIYLHKKEFYLLPMIKHCMEDFDDFGIPIKAEIEWGNDWGHLQELKE